MALDLPDLHDRALDGTRRYVAGVGEGQRNGASPCEGWDVRELVNHIVSGNFWAGELARGKTIEDVGACLDGDGLGAHPAAADDGSRRPPDLVARAAGSRPVACSFMGQPITVTARPGASPSVRLFDLNRSLTGMEIERYHTVDDPTGDRPPDVLARRLFDLGATRVTI